ncbi:hypothetical protein [Nocardioides sp. GXZ039]|uniref:hypothetical protein n=1 Tax=Nocardioides sp. GXZ039 TaxID=3136018 RepID=UPI0030F471B1
MSVGTTIRRRRPGRWSRSQQALRALVAAGPVVAILAAWPAGDGPPVVIVVVVAALALAHASHPDSGFGLVVFVVVLAWWLKVPGSTLHPALLVAAGALLAAHLAAMLAATAPRDAAIDPALARRWIARGAGVLAVVLVMWVLARLLDGRTPPAGLWAAGLSAVLLATIGAAFAFPRRPALE